MYVEGVNLVLIHYFLDKLKTLKTLHALKTSLTGKFLKEVIRSIGDADINVLSPESC